MRKQILFCNGLFYIFDFDNTKEYSENKGVYSVGYIASAMDYGLSEENLSRLALIHKNSPKDSKRRAVIEQLLECINYHLENKSP